MAAGFPMQDLMNVKVDDSAWTGFRVKIQFHIRTIARCVEVEGSFALSSLIIHLDDTNV